VERGVKRGGEVSEQKLKEEKRVWGVGRKGRKEEVKQGEEGRKKG
jgi:hypothetical protein